MSKIILTDGVAVAALEDVLAFTALTSTSPMQRRWQNPTRTILTSRPTQVLSRSEDRESKAAVGNTSCPATTAMTARSDPKRKICIRGGQSLRRNRGISSRQRSISCRSSWRGATHEASVRQAIRVWGRAQRVATSVVKPVSVEETLQALTRRRMFRRRKSINVQPHQLSQGQAQNRRAQAIIPQWAPMGIRVVAAHRRK